jgi:hypothetical protein
MRQDAMHRADDSRSPDARTGRPGTGSHLDVHEAALIMQEADQRARHEFRRNHRGSFTAWGVILLRGYGTMWPVVRGNTRSAGRTPGRSRR